MRPTTEPFADALAKREAANGRLSRLAGKARTVIDDLDNSARKLTTQPYHLSHR
jgi:hypothetical protein